MLGQATIEQGIHVGRVHHSKDELCKQSAVPPILIAVLWRTDQAEDSEEIVRPDAFLYA